nr:hypothetical protein [Geminicoccus flavidas]
MIVDLDPGHDVLVAIAPARVPVHRLDQQDDAAHPVTDHARRHAFGDGHHLAADHQDPVVVPLVVLLDDHAAIVPDGLLEAATHLLGGHEPDRDAATVIAVQRLGHHRIADALRRTHSRIGAAHDRTFGNRQPGRVQQDLGEVLVSCRVRRDLRGRARDAGTDALLVTARAQLHEALVIEAQHRDALPFRLLNEGAGGGAECRPPVQPPQDLQSRAEIECLFQCRLVIVLIDAVEAADAPESTREQRIHELQRQASRQEPDGLFLIGVHDVVDARAPLHGPGLAAGDGRPRQRLELEADMLGNVSQPSPVLQASHEAAWLAIAAAVLPQARQKAEQAVGKTGQPVAGAGLQRAQIELDADHGRVAVEVGPAIDPTLQDRQRSAKLFRGAGAWGRLRAMRLAAECWGPVELDHWRLHDQSTHWFVDHARSFPD